MIKYLLQLIMVWISLVSKVSSIEIPMDMVNWAYKGGYSSCKLEYYSPEYGKFYFLSNKKDDLSFVTELDKRFEPLRTTALFSMAAPWFYDDNLQLISDVSVIKNNKITFYYDIEILLNAVASGDWFKLMLGGSNTSASFEYVIPAVHLQEGLSKFKRCRDALPEMSFAEARDVFIYFVSGQRVLTAVQRKQIKSLHSYLDVDPHISKVLIDGYTDSEGGALVNLTISRQRAQLVAGELIKLGVSDEMIEIRAHGSRYPVTSNKTKAGRAKNRRVTIRLVRDNEEVVPAKRE